MNSRTFARGVVRTSLSLSLVVAGVAVVAPAFAEDPAPAAETPAAETPAAETPAAPAALPTPAAPAAPAAHPTRAAPATPDPSELETSDESERIPRRRWYGVPMIIADGVAGTVMLIGVAADDYKVLFPVGAAFTITDGLLVHAQNGHWGKGFLSLLMRGAASFGGCAISPGCFGNDKPSALAIVGFTGGFLVAASVDVAFLAWDGPAKRSAAPSSTADVGISVGPRGALLGVRGAF